MNPRSGSSPVTVEPLLLDPKALVAFAAGTSTRAHEILGARVQPAGAVDFAVWAPHAKRVTVIGDFDEWTGQQLTRVGDSGIFAGKVRGASVGHRYKYRIFSKDGQHDKADPYGYAAEIAPKNASVIATLEHAWNDAAWMKTRGERARLDRPISIYEVHLGSWRRNLEEGGRMLGYREIAAPLAEHATKMGFTHVELMPVLEHPFYGSWGYGVTGFFAATSRYGSPADLMFLVDTLHAAGLAVVFDWVPAHFARDEHGLAMFDGGPTYEPSDPARAVHPTWQSGLFDHARPEVRSFLLSSATFWIEAFHADGLRVDGVESILYADHGRVATDAQKREENPGGVSFLRELTTSLDRTHPDVLLSAEDSSAWPGVTHGAPGLGFDLKWDMGFSHDMRRYLSFDPIDRSQHQGILTFRSVYGPSEAFVIPLSHDDVVAERGGGLLQQVHGDPWQRFANLRLLYATAWSQPGKKLMFMGDEWGQSGPWHHDRSLDWHEGLEPAHDGIARMVGDLNRVYRETRALHEGDASDAGFEWIDGTNAEMSVITFLRWDADRSAPIVVACNFTPVPRIAYRIGVPRGGLHYREIFNSDAAVYGGAGVGNMGSVDIVPVAANGRPSSIVVTLPPLAILLLART